MSECGHVSPSRPATAHAGCAARPAQWARAWLAARDRPKKPAPVSSMIAGVAEAAALHPRSVGRAARAEEVETRQGSDRGHAWVLSSSAGSHVARRRHGRRQQREAAAGSRAGAGRPSRRKGQQATEQAAAAVWRKGWGGHSHWKTNLPHSMSAMVHQPVAIDTSASTPCGGGAKGCRGCRCEGAHGAVHGLQRHHRRPPPLDQLGTAGATRVARAGCSRRHAGKGGAPAGPAPWAAPPAPTW